MQYVETTCQPAGRGRQAGRWPSGQCSRLVTNPTVARRHCRCAATTRASGAAAELKGQLLQFVSRLNSSAQPASQQQLGDLLQLVSQLEKVNPTPDPGSSPLLNGTWVLVYTASTGSRMGGFKGDLNPVFSVFQAASDVLYRAFYSYAPVLAGSAVGKWGSGGGIRSRGNFQMFDLSAGTVKNEARIELLGKRGTIEVWGTAEVIQGSGGRATKSRLRAMFTRFAISLEGTPTLALPLAVPDPLRGGALQGPVGYVDTVYLDEEIRISFGDKGSLFIAARDKSASAAAAGAVED